jgi:branched-chain amino acid transport system substrate-binding protein
MKRRTRGLAPNTRRDFLAGSAAIGAALAAGVVSPAVWAQAGKPVKLGVVLTLSGGLATQNEQDIAGMKLFFEQRDYQAGGRKIALIIEDDQGNPQVGRNKARKLVESDEVDMVVGPQNSGVAIAMIDYLKQAGTLHLISAAGSRVLTREKRHPLLFRSSCSTFQMGLAMADWFAKNLGKEAITIASDFAGGRDSGGEFKLAFAQHGGKVVNEIWPPLGNKDFAPYFAELRGAKVAGVFAFFPGADAVRFVQQYDQFGLKDLPLTGLGFMADSDTLPAQGRTALGIRNVLHYTPTLDNPENRSFVAAYQAKYKEKPGVTSEYGFVAARIITDALDKAQGDMGDKKKFAEIMQGTDFKAPRGPFRFDPANNNVILTEYIREVREVNGEIDNYVIATYPDIVDPVA